MSVRHIDGHLWLDTARIESVHVSDALGYGTRVVRITMQSGTVHDVRLVHPQGGAAPAGAPDQLAATWIHEHLGLIHPTRRSTP